MFPKIFQQVSTSCNKIFCNVWKKCCDDISIAMKYWKYFWHVSAIFCAIWGGMKKFFIYIILPDMNYWKRDFERFRSGCYFFNLSPCKFSLLDRRSLFSNRVTYVYSIFLLSSNIDTLLMFQTVIRQTRSPEQSEVKHQD